jgi:hypothetical protein
MIEEAWDNDDILIMHDALGFASCLDIGVPEAGPQ